MIGLNAWRTDCFDMDECERDLSNTPLVYGEEGEFHRRLFPMVFIPHDAIIRDLTEILYWPKAYSDVEVVEDGIVVELRMKPEHMKEVITILDSIGGYTLRRKQENGANKKSR